MKTLPCELLLIIFEFSETSSLINLISTCSLIYNLSEEYDEFIWKNRCDLIFNVTLEKIKKKKWKDYSIEKYFNDQLNHLITKELNKEFRYLKYFIINKQLYLFKTIMKEEKDIGLFDLKENKIEFNFKNILNKIKMNWNTNEKSIIENCKLGCSINKNIGELIENEEMMKYQKFGMTKEELKNNDLSIYLPKKLESKKDDIEEYIFYTTEWLKIKLVFKNKMNEEIQKNEQYISTIILLRHDEEEKKKCSIQ
eukprot:gene1846-987_t